MKKEEFITLLEELKKNKYDFKEVDHEELLSNLLANIGDHSPYLRDELVYPVLAHLLHDNVLENERLIDFTYLLLSKEYLFFDIDNDIEYSVLIRSFSMLQLAILIYVHNRDNLFDEQQITHIINEVTTYLKQETDQRGFLKEYGYLHAVAHTADTLTQLVKTKEIKDYQLRSIMDLIHTTFDTSNHLFDSDEDERTVNCLEVIIRSNRLDKEYLIMYIDTVSNLNLPNTYPENYNLQINIKSLLRSLYFRFIYDEEYNFLTDKIKEVLKEKVKLR